MSGDPLPTFPQPYDWDAIDGAVRSIGGGILAGFLDSSFLVTLNHEIDTYLDEHVGAGAAVSGSKAYDRFLGNNTIRLHGLIEKFPSATDVIGDPRLVDWASRIIGDRAASVLLNAGELIQIQPGEHAQFPHRDSDSWPDVPLEEEPVVVNAIVALDDCTLDNGATYVAAGSWDWELDRRVSRAEWTRAVMNAGDALLFRGDLLHRGGENTSDARRRVISISYCAGWLRTVENSFLNVGRDTAAGATATVRSLLGYSAHDAGDHGGGLIGLFENGDPAAALSGGGSG